MTTNEIAAAFTDLCKAGKFEEAGKHFWSDDIVSRTERAFSRAKRRHDAIEFGLSESYARYAMTLACVAAPYFSRNTSVSPFVSISGCH